MAVRMGRRGNRSQQQGNDLSPPVLQELAGILIKAGYELKPAKQQKSFLGFLKAVQESGSFDPTVRTKALTSLDADYGTGYETIKANVTKTAMGEESGVTGGYLIPMEFTESLMGTLEEESFIYPRATIVPMGAAEILAPKIDAESVPTNAGTSPFFGGVLFKWGSSQAPAETEPTFRQLSLKAWDLLGYLVVSNQFLMDLNPKGDEYLLRLMGRAAAWYAEYAFLQGTGTAASMPLGILNAPAAVTVTRATGNQISNVDIAKMSAKLLPYSWKYAIWAASPSCLAQIIAITNFFINVQAHEEGGQAGSLMTRPLFVTEKLASLGTQGDLILFDPNLYIVGDRMQILIDVSPHSLFNTYQTVFRVWLRMDGKPQVSKAITLQDKSTTVSPYVILQ